MATRRQAQHWWLAAALLLGLAIRVPLLIAAQSDGPVGDQLQYSAQAHSNSEGRWFEQPFDPGKPAAEHPPLTSLVLTPITWAAQDTNIVLVQRLAMLALGMANIVLLFLLGRRWSGRVAVAAALLAAVDVHLFLSDVLVLSETLGITLMTLLLLVLTRPVESRRVGRDAALTGLLLGLLLLTRPELVLLFPLVTVWLWRFAPRLPDESAAVRALAPAGIAVLVVAPWVLWNQARFEDSVTLSTNDGFTLLGANCPDTYYGDNIGGYSIECALAVTGSPGMDASEVSAVRREVAIDYVREHPERLPVVAAGRFLRQWELGWIGRTAGDSVDEGRPPTLVLLGSFQWWLYGALAIVGLVRTERARRLLVLMPPLVVTVAAVGVNAEWRVRATAEPSVVVAAAVGVVALLGRTRWGPRADDGSDAMEHRAPSQSASADRSAGQPVAGS